jgi:uncharacterized delta-60 repeat protein
MKHTLRLDPHGCLFSLWLLVLWLLPWAALAQAPVITVAPAGPLTLCPGSTQLLTATAAANVPGFNVAGSGFDNSVQTLAVQPDGKVLVGGDFTSYNGDAAAPNCVLRLNADGSLDKSFNYGGAGGNSTVWALVVQPDGKILMGGSFSTYNGKAAAPDCLVRLNADGSLDNTFDNGGSGFNGTALALAVQADGKVLVGGGFTSYNGSVAVPQYLLRLTTSGALDTSFNPSGAGANSNVYALAVQADGKVLVGGGFTSYNGNAATPDRMMRITANGALDASFNPGGAGADNFVQALALQADGKVVIGGNFTSYNGAALAPDRVLRLNADGSLDNVFNTSGLGANSIVNELATQPDGKVLVAGAFTSYNGSASASDYLLRLNVDGTLDTGFNSGGTGTSGQVSALAVQANGKILAGGDFMSYNRSSDAPDYLLGLNADGSLNNAASVPAGLAYTWSSGATGASITVSQPGDYQATATTTANGTGYSNVVRVSAPPAVTVQVTPAGPLALTGGGSATLTATATVPGFDVAGSGFNGSVSAVVVQPDGKVLVGGAFNAYNGNAAAPDYLLRLNPDGSLDTSFNLGGAGVNSTVSTLAVQPDGKVLVGGTFTAYNGNAAPKYLLRLNSDGSLDTSFNPGGIGAGNYVYALAVQVDGKVLAGGSFTSYNGNASAPDCLLRLNADGSLDPSFNPGGAGASSTVLALVVQPDGKVLVGGNFTTYNGSTAPKYLLRLNADGALDTSFNPGGAGAETGVSALAVQPDGKVLIAGGFTSYNGNAAAPDRVLRLTAIGALDTSFNPGGAGVNNNVYALAVQADGKVLVGGNFTSYNGSTAVPKYLLRLTTSGSLDTSFNPGGTGTGNYVLALAVQPDGKLLAGGNFTSYNGSAAAPKYLLRLNADGSLNNAATALPGATFGFNPGGTTGATRTVSTAGTYTATATDPATGCTYSSNAVVVTTPAPILTSLLPTSGLAGSTLAAAGTYLQGASVVTFTSSAGAATAAPAGYVVASDGTGITGIAVPAGLAAGTYTLTVTTPNGNSNGLAFTVQATAPAITSFAPVSGPVGTSVTFTGTGFSPVASQNVVFFGATLAPVTAASATSLTVTVPLGTTYQYPTVTNLATSLTAYASQPFVVTLSGAVAFDPKVDFSVGLNPNLMAIGDLDGDGKPDLATANNADNTVSVLHNTSTAGTVSFAPAVSLATASGPYSLAIGDVDGDGKLDLVTANDNSGTVSVLRNTSTAGTVDFATKVDFSAGPYPVSVAIGDLDGDGKPDLAVANFFTDNTVSVLRNTSTVGTVSFAAGVKFPTGVDVQSVTIGDVDGDGKPELATANYTANTVSVLRNTSTAGTVSFATKLDVGTGSGPGWITIGDLDGDGKPDLAVANYTDNSVSILRNLSSAGAVSFASKVDVGIGLYLYSVSIGDLNGDGTPDLAIASRSNTVSVLRNTSTAGAVSFATKVDVGTGSYPRLVAIGDLDGDGKPDLATNNTGSGTVSVLRQVSDGAVLPVTLTSFTATAGVGATVRLAWATSSEVNSKTFEVERSPDSVAFAKIGTLAAAGNAATARAYALLDAYLPAGASQLYYRLRQVDADGAAHYSPVRTVALAGASAGTSLYPNPAHGGTATLLGAQPGTVATVLDALGRPVVTSAPADASGVAQLTLPQGLAAGVYVVRAGSKALRLTVE